MSNNPFEKYKKGLKEMKRWDMLHKIKDCKNNGMSQRATQKQLGIHRDTIRKYWDMKEDEICERLEKRVRSKDLVPYKDYIIHLLEKYPDIGSPNIRRKLENKGIKVEIKARAFRYYISSIKKEAVLKQRRYYAPVIDMLPGVQAQVDIGESRKVIIGGEKVRLYFTVMLLSYSRYMYCGFSLKPYNTRSFIDFHNEAFRYFDGIPDEIVYDQTKLVVIEEKYREVYFNEKYYEYATRMNFSPWVCEGYDPESKGKVEASVKYIKNNFLYGEEFDSFGDLEEQSRKWLNEVANERIHGTTRREPCKIFEEEKKYLKPYKEVIIKHETSVEIRRVDKTGLISYKGNKYSVPEKYQTQTVSLEETGEGRILVSDMAGRDIAEHLLSFEKGQIITNPNHYRDHSKTIKDREKEVKQILPDELADSICTGLRKTNPRIYKDQLVGLSQVCSKYPLSVTLEVLNHLQSRDGLRVTLIEDFIKAKIGSWNTEKISGEINLSRYSKFDMPQIKQHGLTIYNQLGGETL